MELIPRHPLEISIGLATVPERGRERKEGTRPILGAEFLPEIGKGIIGSLAQWNQSGGGGVSKV